MKNQCLFGGWILMAPKVYRRENLSCKFEGWLYCLCKRKSQASYNYRNLFKLMIVAPKLMNTTYFVTKSSCNILMNRTHRRPGNMCFLAHVKIVFLTLQNQLLHTEIRKLCLECLVLFNFYFAKALCNSHLHV